MDDLTLNSADNKLAFAICFMNYPIDADYIEALEYSTDILKGKESYTEAKFIYTQLHIVFTDDEIKALINGR